MKNVSVKLYKSCKNETNTKQVRLNAFPSSVHFAFRFRAHMRKSCDIRCNFTLSEVRVRSVFVFMDFF